LAERHVTARRIADLLSGIAATARSSCAGRNLCPLVKYPHITY
jgi:hypothetical protein